MILPAERDDPVWMRLRDHDISELWDHSRAPHVAAAYASRLRLLRSLVTRFAPAGGRVLDVGCAQGTLSLQLAEAGYRVTLLDVRADAIEYARARYTSGAVEFCIGHLDRDCPPSADFDVTICTEVLEHVRAPALLLQALAEKTHPGGVVLISTPNAQYFRSRLPSYGSASQETILSAEQDSMDGDAHRYLYTREELLALVRGVGLSVVDAGFFDPFWLAGHMKTRYLHSAYRRLTGRLLHHDALPARVSRHARALFTGQWCVGRRATGPS